LSPFTDSARLVGRSVSVIGLDRQVLTVQLEAV
jgi:hypothetical protein